MANVFIELFKDEIGARSIDITIERLKKVTNDYSTGQWAHVVRYLKIPVRITIFKDPLHVGSSGYNLWIEADEFDNRSPYYNGEDINTNMTLDRVLFYLRYYMEAG